MKGIRNRKNRKDRKVDGRVPYNAGESELLLSQRERGRIAGGTTFLAPVYVRGIIWSVVIATAVTALILGAVTIWRTNPYGSFTNDAIESTMINVTAKLNATDASIDNAWIDEADLGSLEAENGTFVQLESTNASIGNAWIDEGHLGSLEAENASVTSLEVDMVTHAVYEHTESGSVRSEYNLQTINSATDVALSVTTDDIGKRFRVCSLGGGGSHTLDVSPLKWDTPNGYWEVIKFDAAASGCCVEYEVLSATQVALISRGDKCTTFCVDSDLLFCVDPERPEETNPFHGTWQMVLKEQQLLGVRQTSRVEIDATRYPALLTQFVGTVANPHDGTPLEPLFELPFWSYTQDTVIASPIFDLEFDFGIEAITVQPGTGDIVLYALTSLASGVDRFTVFKRVDSDGIAPPRQFGLVLSEDVETPQAILKQMSELMLYGGNNHIATAYNDEKYIGTPAATALLDTIISVGVVESQSVYKIFITQNPDDGFTKLRFENYHHVVPPTTVTITGCTGDYASMNGEHDIHPGITTNHRFVDGDFHDFGPVVDNRTQHHDVGIVFNTTGFSADAEGVATSTGPCALTVSYGPITDNSEYIDTLGAYGYWVYESFQVAQHSSWSILGNIDNVQGVGFSPHLPPIKTWVELQSAIDEGKTFAFNSQTRAEGSASMAYNNWPATESIFQFQNGLSTITPAGSRYVSFDVNNRFQIRPDIGLNDVDASEWFSVFQRNYLEDVMVPYFRCQPTGNTKIHPENLFAGFVYGSLDGGCDFFEGINRPIGEIAPPNEHFFNRRAGINGGCCFPFYSDFPDYATQAYQELIYYGRVNTSYTGGKSIGYIRFDDFQLLDTFEFLVEPVFADSPTAESVSANQRVALNRIWADTALKYLVDELQVESIIIDIRNNGGGFIQPILALREMFGSGSPQVITGDELVARADAGNGNLFDITTLTTEGSSKQFRTTGNRIYPDEIAALYPDSIFRGGSVHIVTDMRAISGGDFFPGVFLNATLGRDIGSSTTTKIFGDIDGRLAGFFGSPNTILFSETNPRIRDVGGNAFSPIDISFDFNTIGFRSDGTSSWANRVAGIKPDCAPTLRGKTGGCAFPNDPETILFPDWGYTPNTRPRLSGDTRPQQPDPMDRSTRRDVWLEEVTQIAIDAPAPVPFSKKRRVVSKFQPRNKKTLTSQFGSSILCENLPENVQSQLTLITQVNGTIPVTITRPTGEQQRISIQERRVGTSIFLKEMRSGGLCINAQNQVMVTPTCQGLPLVSFRK